MRVMELMKDYANLNLTSLQRKGMIVSVILFRPVASSTAYRKYTRAKKSIMKETQAEYLKMPEPPSIPGRPIVGGPNCPANKLSNLMDLILKPVVYKVITYVKYSFHFLEMLQRKIDFQSTFVTFNITSHYTNISHDLGLETINNFYMTGSCPFFKNLYNRVKKKCISIPCFGILRLENNRENNSLLFMKRLFFYISYMFRNLSFNN